MKHYLLKTIGLICLLLVVETAAAQIAKCKGKYLGNIISGSVPGTYTTYWNQVTSENGSKWGSVEGTQGVYNFGNSDLAYNWAKNNNGLFKYHNLIWGGQTPGWVGTASTATITAAIDPYFKAVQAHYASMGGIKLMDVLNEPVNTPMPGNLKAALTAGYQAEPANANDKNNQYGWAIWCFQLARKYFPTTTLLVNEYNIEMNWNNCRAPYIAMVQAIKNAPNLTDGSKNLIDGVGLQCHGIDNLTAANFKACIDEIWTKTGVAVHITEFDQTANPNEAKQQAVYSSLIPVAWEHPHVAGITLWGYIQGQTWIGGNGQTGASGTDSGIIYANGTERPAMTWLKQYFASQPSLSCCPAPGPFASCSTTNPSPVITVTAPATSTVYTEGDNVTLSATATITTGSISKVDFYQGTTLLGTDAIAPYSYTWNTVAAGNYTITAIATSAASVTTTSSAVAIQVAKPVYQTGSSPVIDGTVDGLWSNFPSVSINKVISGTVGSASDLSGNWKAMWDATNLYVLVQVTDDVKKNDAGTDVYNDDGVEVYIDMGNSKATTYGTNDEQYTFRWNDATAAYEINGHSVTGITKGITNTATGYIVEVSIPWSTMGGMASVNALAGFDVMINDDDDGGARDGKMAWTATTDDTWSNPSLMGTIILKGLNCTVPTAAISTTAPTTFCSGGSVTLNASTGTGYSYVWKNGTTTITGATASAYTATTAGSYTVQITNAGGCSATSAATAVTVNALPAITQYAQIDGGAWNQTNTATVCIGSSIILGPQPTTTTGWSWTGPNGYAATSREITLASVTASQGGTYTASYTDGNTCKSSATFTLTVNALPTAAITTTTSTAFCQGSSVMLTASTGTSYKWLNGPAAITGATTQTYTATTAGSYSVEVTNANSCKATSAATTLTVNAIPAAPAVTTPVMYCQNATAAQLSATGTNLKWYTAATGGMPSATAATPTTAAAGTTNYYVSQTTNTCESARAQIAVTVNALPTAAITTTTSTTFCQGGSVMLTAGTGTSYKWLNGTTAIAGATTQAYTATTAGSYSVEVTNANNCKATSAATIVTVNAISAAPAVTTPVMYCQNETAVQLSATGTNLKWYTAATGGTGSATAPTPGTATAGTINYYVSQTSNTCESGRALLAITVTELPVATITANGPVTIVQGGSVVLTASSGTSYQWLSGTTAITGATAQSYTATAAGSYAVAITNSSNCTATSAAMHVTVTTTTVNQPSVITITSPQPNTTISGSINIAVDVTDPDGSITLVEFLDGSTVIGTSTTAPYTFTWDNPPAGTHSITVRVTDSNGGVTTSAAVNVTAQAITTGLYASNSNTLNGVVYPNPSNGIVFIDSDTDLSDANFMLVDVMGNEHTLLQTANGLGAKVDVSNLSDGTYVLIIKKEQSVMRKKITVIR